MLCSLYTELELTNVLCESQTHITVHTVQLLPEKSFRENENREVVNLENNGCAKVVLRVMVSVFITLFPIFCVKFSLSRFKSIAA